MTQRHLIVITKVILFYSIFVLVMKMIFLFQQYYTISNALQADHFNALALAQSVLMLPFLVLAIAAYFINRNKTYNWIFVLVGAAVIIGIRAFEIRMLEYLQNYFLN